MHILDFTLFFSPKNEFAVSPLSVSLREYLWEPFIKFSQFLAGYVLHLCVAVFFPFLNLKKKKRKSFLFEISRGRINHFSLCNCCAKFTQWIRFGNDTSVPYPWQDGKWISILLYRWARMKDLSVNASHLPVRLAIFSRKAWREIFWGRNGILLYFIYWLYID